ncbi:MAG: hypothetical protein L0Y76_08645 [Ignavibacteria bacterium]|nr:hypothetical protein [Ignavibacteria bacterium]
MSSPDFTTVKFSEILNSVISNYKTYTINEWISGEYDMGIVIRHDVDRRNKHALRIAKMEYERNIRATYYFRVSTFDKEIVRDISALGHEIGYHYEDLSSNNGDFDKAIKSFEQNLEDMRNQSGLNINTIAMHGRWISGYDNRELWSEHDFRDFGVISDAFISIDYRKSYYITDTGRNWSSNSANLRDKVDSEFEADCRTSDELIRFIKSGHAKRIFLVSHPERWDESYIPRIMHVAEDKLKNSLKTVKKILLPI